MWSNLFIIARIALELWKKRKEKQEEPDEQNLARRQELGRAVAQGDATAVNLALHDMLQRLRNPPAGGNSKRSGG